MIATVKPAVRLMVQLMYGCGLRVLEVYRLRVKDVDLGCLQTTVRDGKGAKDRITMLPVSWVEDLRRQIETVRFQHHVLKLRESERDWSKATMLLKRNG